MGLEAPEAAALHPFESQVGLPFSKPLTELFLPPSVPATGPVSLQETSVSVLPRLSVALEAPEVALFVTNRYHAAAVLHMLRRTVSLHGATVYVENVVVGLKAPEVGPSATGKYTHSLFCCALCVGRSPCTVPTCLSRT